MARGSDSDLAFRLQVEEALAASLSFRRHTPPRSPSPIMARCGFVTVVEDDRRSSARQTEPPSARVRNRGPDVGKSSGEGSSNGERKVEKLNGKGNMYVKATSVGGDDRKTAGKSSICENPTGKPSLVIRQAKPSGEGCSKGPAASARIKEDVVYRLYSKGLVSEETGKGDKKAVVAGFGVAICDQADNRLFEIKGALPNTDMSRNVTEIRALIRGLTEVVSLGIKRVAFYCDYYPLYQFVSGRWTPKQKKIAMLVNDALRLRQQLTSSKPILVARNDIKFAFRLAREAIVSQISIPPDSYKVKAAQKETCVICLEDTDAERMFSVDKCLHRYCFSCVKQYVEVKLLHGMAPKCPHVGCKSKLSVDSCGKLLTSKLIEMWKQRMKEDSIPVTEKIYCPYPRCSALMSKKELSESAKRIKVDPDKSGVRKCVECHGFFCINCKVPWHSNLSCTDYKKLHPNPPADDAKLKSLANRNMWRQCVKCQHMIELSEGCYHMTCRCGYEFCYNCGAEWKREQRTCPSCPLFDVNHLLHRNAVAVFYDDSDHEDDEYDDYDYDIDDYLGFGPFVYDSDDDDDDGDDVLLGPPLRWFGVGQPQEDHEGLETLPPHYDSDEIWDEEDSDYDNEEEYLTTEASSDEPFLSAVSCRFPQDHEDDPYEEEIGTEDENIAEQVHGGGGEEDESVDEEVYHGNEHFADWDYEDAGNDCGHGGDDYGYSGDDYSSGGDDYAYGGDGYGDDDEWW